MDSANDMYSKYLFLQQKQVTVCASFKIILATQSARINQDSLLLS